MSNGEIGVVQGNLLQEFKDSSARTAFGQTLSEAHTKGTCIMCEKKPDLSKSIDAAEYKISGLCNICWDEITKIGDEDA